MLTSLIAFIVIIGVLVTIHEFGHYLAARSVGVTVEKFYIGFNAFGYGFKKVINGTEYGIGWLPLGGYVKLAGMLDESFDTERSDDPGDFHLQPIWAKIWIMSAGVIMNFILAIIIFAMMTFIQGELVGHSEEPIIGSVIKEQYDANINPILTPAFEANLKGGDRILQINDSEIKDWADISNVISADSVLKTYDIKFDRGGQLNTISIKPAFMKLNIEKDSKLNKSLGIMPVPVYEERNIFQSTQVGARNTVFITIFLFDQIAGIVTGKNSANGLGGPIAIAGAAGDSLENGLVDFFYLMALLSISLGVMNILPIPGLDGGHVFITLIEGAIGRELSVETKMRIQQVGVAMILLLFVFIMYNDIVRIFS